MEKVNIYCDKVSVERKVTIAVLMDLPLDPGKLQQELGNRLAKKVKERNLNPGWIREGCEVRGYSNRPCKFSITYPPSLENIEDLILESLAEVEEDIAAVVEADRFREMLRAD